MMLRESILSSDRLFFIFGPFQVWICHLHRQFWQKWYLEIVITYIQKNRRQVNFCSKWSLIHTNDAPWKYFEFWPPVFYIWTFSGLDLSFAPPILAKVIFRNSHYLYTKKSQASKFLLKVVAYTYQWCSVKVFWVLTACFLYLDLFRFGFVICTANFGKSDI